MENRFKLLSSSEQWRTLVDAAKRGAQESGYALERKPGRGLSNVWKATRERKTFATSIRTTRDRWIAFPPLNHGTKWKTLDDVELVIVAAVNSKEDPTKIEVYIFPAHEVRKRFDSAYAARTDAGQRHKDNFGMWIGLDRDMRHIPVSVGSGIVEDYEPVGIYDIDEFLDGSAIRRSTGEVQPESGAHDEKFKTISEVMKWAREKVAQIAGVHVDSVRLDLKLES